MRLLCVLCILSLLLIACASEPQLPPPRPELPDNNAVVVVDADTPGRPDIETLVDDDRAALEDLLMEEPPEAFTIVWDTRSTIGENIIKEKSVDYISKEKGTKFSIKRSVTNTSGNTIEEFELYYLPTGFVQCVKDIGWGCVSFPNQLEPTEELVPEDLPENTATITEISGKRLAGQETRCFKSEAEPITQEACYAKSVLLYLKVTGPGVSVVRRAESLTQSVPEDIYDLPSTPRPAVLN